MSASPNAALVRRLCASGMAPEVTEEVMAPDRVRDITSGFPNSGVHHGWDDVAQNFFGRTMPNYESCGTAPGARGRRGAPPPQGRLQASAPLLTEIAKALRLSEDQRTYLFGLAAKQTASSPGPGGRQRLDPQLQRMLDDLSAPPAFVIGRRTDILGWNRLAAALWTDFGRFPEPQRVFVRLLFTEPCMRELYADWEEVTDQHQPASSRAMATFATTGRL